MLEWGEREPNGVLFERRGRDSHELELTRRVVSLDRLGLDDDGCVTPLVVLALVRNRPRHVTTRQSERGAQCRQCCNQHGDDDFDNLLLTHNQPPIKSPFAS